MAYDKLVDSAALEANLTTIANAIREKGGTTDTLAFPEGFVEAIAGISAGEPVVYGELTVAEDILLHYDAGQTYHYATGLGYAPKVFAMIHFSGGTSAYSLMASTFWFRDVSGPVNLVCKFSSSGYGSSTINSANKTLFTTSIAVNKTVFDWESGEIPIYAHTVTSNQSYLRAGYTYGWVAIGKAVE